MKARPLYRHIVGNRVAGALKPVKPMVRSLTCYPRINIGAAPPRSDMNSRRFPVQCLRAPTERIAHLNTAGDSRAAGFRLTRRPIREAVISRVGTFRLSTTSLSMSLTGALLFGLGTEALPSWDSESFATQAYSAAALDLLGQSR
jgi:hypothetical protein